MKSGKCSLDAGNLGFHPLFERAVRKPSDMISFVIVLFYMITVFGVIYLRIKQPALERPYKTWLYPVTPIIYLL
jgi:amino acid transporter